MSTNAELAARFEQMAAVLELLGANPFRSNAYRRGARALGELTRDVAELVDRASPDPAALTAIEGIGSGLAGKIIEHLTTGRIAEIDQTLAQVPSGVLRIMRIPGLGPKTVALLWKEGGVDSVAELKRKIDAGELANLPRMGEKTLANIRRSIEFAESSGGRTRLGDASAAAAAIVAALREMPGVKAIDSAGSLRRGCETIGDIDIVVGCPDPEKQGEAIGERFRQLPGVKQVLAAGPTKSSVRLAGAGGEAWIQADLRVVRADRYGAALLYFTGSKAHNVALRELAQKLELRLNEYGLWRAEGFDKLRMDDPGASPVAAKSEAEVYAALNLPFIPPELREDRGELDAAIERRLPRLVEPADLRADLHTHTTASDGVWSIDELAEHYQRLGYHTVAITDHSASSVIANGLDARRLERHITAVRQAGAKLKGLTLLAGSEVDILTDGKLDYPDSLLKELDLVIASPHASLKQEPDRATRRLLRAIENPYVHILGHPTGRLINQREGLSPDFGALFKAATQANVAMEINASPFRLDLNDLHARAAIGAGCLLSINTDAHGPSDPAMMTYGVTTARRAWAEPRHIINCMTAVKLKAWLAAKRG
jgi:DNA polymerase (family 10)